VKAKENQEMIENVSKAAVLEEGGGRCLTINYGTIKISKIGIRLTGVASAQ